MLPNAKEARITLTPGKIEEHFTIGLRHLDPVTLVTGQQARLKKLGMFSGAVDSVALSNLSDAIRSFQASRSLLPTGEIDEATGQALETAHRC